MCLIGPRLGGGSERGWRCQRVCRGRARPVPGDPSRPIFGVFDAIESAASDERVREAMGLSKSKRERVRWIGLLPDTQPDGSRLVVGVCHAHNTPRGCPGHPLALRYLSDGTACCVECGRAVTSHTDGVNRVRADGVDAHLGVTVRDSSDQVTGWICLGCRSKAKRRAGPGDSLSKSHVFVQLPPIQTAWMSDQVNAHSNR